jgi:hypothetical protein
MEEDIGLVELHEEGDVDGQALGVEGILLHHQRAHLKSS